MLDEIVIWREKVVGIFPQVNPDKIKKAFDEGLAAYRDPKTRYKFNNPYHQLTACESLTEMECLDSAFCSGWSAGVFDRRQRCLRCGYQFIPRGSEVPKTCPNPKCKSPYWNKPRVRLPI